MQGFYNLNKEEIWALILAFIVFAVVQLLKQPIKLLTNKITNERIRKIANFSIFIMPFGLGILAQFIFAFVEKMPFNINAGLIVGMTSVTFYGLVERFLKGKKIDNPYSSPDGQALLNAMQAGLKDGKLGKDDLINVAQTIVTAIKQPLSSKEQTAEAENKKHSAVEEFLKYIDQEHNSKQG